MAMRVAQLRTLPSMRALDLVLGGVGEEGGDPGKGSVEPFFKFPVQLGSQLGVLGGGDFEAAEFAHDGGSAPGADALKIHARDGGFEGTVTAAALLQEGGSERDVTAADLRRGGVEAPLRA